MVVHCSIFLQIITCDVMISTKENLRNPSAAKTWTAFVLSEALFVIWRLNYCLISTKEFMIFISLRTWTVNFVYWQIKWFGCLHSKVVFSWLLLINLILTSLGLHLHVTRFCFCSVKFFVKRLIKRVAKKSTYSHGQGGDAWQTWRYVT